MTTLTSPLVSERAIRFKYRADKVPTDQKKSYPNMPTFEYAGHMWQADVLRHGEDLSVYLLRHGPKIDMTINYGVRLIRGENVHVEQPKEIEFTTQTAGGTEGHYHIISWYNLLMKFCSGGEFMIEFYFPSPCNDMCGRLPLTLDSAVGKDISVVCSDVPVKCNKSIVVQECEAMRLSFTNKSSMESMENKFTIGLDCATPENTRLLIMIMYEGWRPDLMDKHAGDLLLMSDCYNCPRVAVAIDALKRRLSSQTFWATASVAATLREGQPKLLKICAEFAGTFERITHLFASEKPRDSATADIVMKKIADLKTKK